MTRIAAATLITITALISLASPVRAETLTYQPVHIPRCIQYIRMVPGPDGLGRKQLVTVCF